MIDLEKLRARASGIPDSDGAIGPTWCTPTEVLELLDHIAQLEKDAGRLDWMVNEQVFMEYERDNYWLVFPDGSEQKSSYITPRQAIDTAMESKHG